MCDRDKEIQELRAKAEMAKEWAKAAIVISMMTTIVMSLFFIALIFGHG